MFDKKRISFSHPVKNKMKWNETGGNLDSHSLVARTGLMVGPYDLTDN